MWQVAGDMCSWSNERVTLVLDPARGLVNVHLRPENLLLSQILGVEIVDAVGLGAKELFELGATPEIVCREDTAQVIYRPTPARPVECHARWRISPDAMFDLEVSTLTPGKWDGLSVQTRSAPTAMSPPYEGGVGGVEGRSLREDLNPPYPPFVRGGQSELVALSALLVLYRPPTGRVSYAEMCHPQDGVGLDLDRSGLIQFRLFGHDLEKGVILRGRLRGVIVPRENDAAEAQRVYEHFVIERPHLSL